MLATQRRPSRYLPVALVQDWTPPRCETWLGLTLDRRASNGVREAVLYEVGRRISHGLEISTFVQTYGSTLPYAQYE